MKKLFEKEFNKAYLKYHANPIAPNSLDPRVWYFFPQGGDPVLQPEIKTQIFQDIDRINSAEQAFVKKRVWDYFMVGPALQENSSDKCSINIVVQIDKTNLDDALKERILQTIKSINGRLATGTTHPLYYIPTIREIDKEKYAAIYHPYTEKWIKKPRFLGESKTDLNNLCKDEPTKQKRKYSLKKGFKKLTTI
jgi:hypothetical protein